MIYIDLKRIQNILEEYITEAYLTSLKALATFFICLICAYYGMKDVRIVFYLTIVPMCVFSVCFLVFVLCAGVKQFRNTINGIEFGDKIRIDFCKFICFKKKSVLLDPKKIVVQPNCYHYQERKQNKISYCYVFQVKNKKYYLPFDFYEDGKAIEDKIKSYSEITFRKPPLKLNRILSEQKK